MAWAEGRLAAARDRARAAARDRARVTERVDMADRGQALLQEAARRTQERLQYQISDLVTAALQAVFPRPYEYALEFREARGRTEARSALRRGGVECEDPLGETGGGVVDVVAFALRVAMWSLCRARPVLPVLVLDEPFRFLSADLRERAAELMRELCGRLGLQIVMVTHEAAFIAAADTIYHLRIGADGVTWAMLDKGTTSQRPARRSRRSRGVKD